MVWSQSFLYDDAWFVVYNADVRVRTEQLERLRWRAQRYHAAIAAAGRTSNYDPAKPWKTVRVRDGVADKKWWSENLHRPAILYLTRTSRRPQLLNMVLHGIALAAHASNHGSPRNPLDQSTLTKEEIPARSSTPRQGAREVPPSVLTSMRAHLTAPAPGHHLLLLLLERSSGRRRRDRMTSRVHSLRGSVWWWAGMRETLAPGCGDCGGPSDIQICVLSRQTGFSLFAGSARRAGTLAACL